MKTFSAPDDSSNDVWPGVCPHDDAMEPRRRETKHQKWKNIPRKFLN
jgi:hypothetical protein